MQTPEKREEPMKTESAQHRIPGEIASESPQIQRTREKLAKRLEALDLAVTPESFRQTIDAIHDWVGRHEEVTLTDRTIHTQEDSKAVSKLRQKLMASPADSSDSPSLKGRVQGGGTAAPSA